MSAEFEISYEVSQKMGMVLASCFEMVGLSTPTHITCDKMALVVDRIDKTRRALKKRLIFSTDENSGKIKEIGGASLGLRIKDKSEKGDKRKAKEVETEAFVLKQIEQEVKKEEKARKAAQEIEVNIESNDIAEFPFAIDCVKEKTAIVSSSLGIMRSQMKMLLKQQGYRVFLVNSAKELSFVMKNNQFDLVVTEIKDSKDLVELAKARRCVQDNVVYMVISADLNNMEVKQCCNDLGINIYIEKHADWQQIMLYKLDKHMINELKYA